MAQEMKTREPKVAGQFYPGKPETLKKMIQDFFENIPETNVEGKIYGIIAPHAGYEYSGQTAAYAFKALQDNVDSDKNRSPTVIVIGISHRYPLRGVSIQDQGYFKTPLGNIEIDETVARTIIKNCKFSDGYVEEADAMEHSVEVEVPFLQAALKDFKIVPIMLGIQSIDVCKDLARAIAVSVKDKDVLMVASSDFYHGYDYDECKNTLTKAVSFIKSYDINGFHNYFIENEQRGRCIACAGGTITTTMLATKDLGANKVRHLYSTNSNDVTGMKGDYCVGYASFIITGRNSSVNIEDKYLTEKEKQILLDIARKSIEKAVKGDVAQGFSLAKSELEKFALQSEKLKEKRGCFVTIKKYGQLRGCIGYIQPIKSLYLAVSEMAVSAALKDPRFPPVKEDELAHLELEISALTPLEEISSPEQIQVGGDGIYIIKGFYSGLLLPQVATEQGWDRMTFLEHTCMKAGLPIDAWKENCNIYIFQAQVFGEK